MKEEVNLVTSRIHPELKGDKEIFLGNIRMGETILIGEKVVTEGRDKGKIYKVYRHNNTETWDDFKKTPFKTKRLGRIAYNSSGKRIQGQRPVFVHFHEYREKGYSSISPFREYYLLKN